MKIGILASIFVTLWTNFASAQALPKFPVVNVTTTTVNDWPWSKGPRYVESKSVIVAAESAPLEYLFYVCPSAEDTDCQQINETPISHSTLSRLVSSGIGFTRHDLPIMMDLAWGDALPTTRAFINHDGPRLLDILKAAGKLPAVETRTWGNSSGRILAEQIYFYARIKLLEDGQ